MSHLGIVEVGAVCARMRAQSMDLFETLGGWVAETEPGPDQRLFAEAAHRHAWHAELWSARSPSIPPVDAAEPVADRAPLSEDPSRSTAYRAALGELLAELESFADRVDPTLDPSTSRTITLVRDDVLGILGRLG